MPSTPDFLRFLATGKNPEHFPFLIFEITNYNKTIYLSKIASFASIFPVILQWKCTLKTNQSPHLRLI